MLKATGKPERGKKLNLNGGVKSWERIKPNVCGAAPRCSSPFRVPYLLVHGFLCRLLCLFRTARESALLPRPPRRLAPAASVLCSCGHPQPL